MAKISNAERIENKKRILEASREVFKVQGFKDTQMKEIALMANVGTSTLYGYFPSKLDLFIEAFFESSDQSFISDQIIEEKLKDGLIEGILDIMIMTVKIDTKEDFELIKSFFLYSLLENIKKNHSEEFLGNRNRKVGLLSRIFEVYERKHLKLVPFSVAAVCERVLNSFTTNLIKGILLGVSDVEVIKAEVRKDLTMVFKGKYKEFE